MAKGEYKTKQREELIEFLSSKEGEHVTVNDVCKHLNESGKKIGTTTVYRGLEKLVDEGFVKKYVLDANSPACFEYINPLVHCGSTCFHLKCTKCGKLIHLHCDDLAETKEHILEHHGFSIDLQRTVFYGVCDKCRED
ncbi:MAG: transcriptional repressor [Lachnospiraceae bacterium]|nr:transcriptional repressor [Lachnospiraceae bacterium]